MIYFITGGARSGKSSYAMDLALSMSDQPVYIATARHWDEDFGIRIRRHQYDRDERWESIEAEKDLSTLHLEGKVAVVDCVTLWLTNYFVDFQNDIDKCLAAFKAEIEALSNMNATLIFVSNELGMGIHGETAVSRKFIDLQGWANQMLGKVADKAYLMVSGIPVHIK